MGTSTPGVTTGWLGVGLDEEKLIAPCRGSAVAFGSTEKVTTPVPVPEDPAAMAIHGTLLDAVHGTGVVPVVTVIDPVPPLPLMLKEGGVTLKVWAPALNALQNRKTAADNPARMDLLRRTDRHSSGLWGRGITDLVA
jgi:hypothetical protein